VSAQQQAFQLTGVVATDRGEYNFLGKRFQIKRGSAMFIGTPDLNPTLQITGEYQVEMAGRGALDINVIIGGTMTKPSLSLESDAQPPKTQSELLSLLAFGQSATSLSSSTTSGSSSIAGSAATMDLFGVGAQMAVRRLASVAVGVMVDQVQVQASRGLGTDVLDITPADVPIGPANTSGFGEFIQNTRIEAGKYINSRTYVSLQEQALRPGLGIEHRAGSGWQFSANWVPRVLLKEPTLNPNPTPSDAFSTIQSFGVFVIREWRF
jgi:translocation and assembly module TamB